MLGRLYWGQGYATEGVRAMMAHAPAVGFGGLEAYSFVDNPASARVLAKAGFVDRAWCDATIRSAAACARSAASSSG